MLATPAFYFMTGLLLLSLSFSATPARAQIVSQQTLSPAVASADTAANLAPVAIPQPPVPNANPQAALNPSLPAQPNAAQAPSSPKNSPMEMISSLLGALQNPENGRDMRNLGQDVPEGTDWDNYSYPDDFTFASGEKGAGNIGNGLCTAKNKDRTQVKNGYCGILAEVLSDPNSCANRAMNEIINAAGPSGQGIGDLRNYCSTWNQITDNTQKSLVFQQVLATLITQESGWKYNVKEPEWSKNGHAMGGKGLFQIAVSDRAQDADCSGLNDSSIMDPRTNLKCGACIALTNLAKDRTMGHGTGDSGARGMARYFGPLRDMQQRKRSEMASAVNQYCVASTGGGSPAQANQAVTQSTPPPPSRAAASR